MTTIDYDHPIIWLHDGEHFDQDETLLTDELEHHDGGIQETRGGDGAESL